MEQKENIKHLVRIANTDLDGNVKMYKGLTKIKGISFMFSNMLCSLTGISKDKKAGTLTDAEIAKLNDVIKDPLKFNAPKWMLNRRKDFEDGKDKHLVAGNISFVQDTDIKIMKKIRCYKGVRHMANLPVRGQKTRSNFRKNKGKVSLGVKVSPKAKLGKT